MRHAFKVHNFPKGSCPKLKLMKLMRESKAKLDSDSKQSKSIQLVNQFWSQANWISSSNKRVKVKTLKAIKDMINFSIVLVRKMWCKSWTETLKSGIFAIWQFHVRLHAIASMWERAKIRAKTRSWRWLTRRMIKSTCEKERDGKISFSNYTGILLCNAQCSVDFFFASICFILKSLESWTRCLTKLPNFKKF